MTSSAFISSPVGPLFVTADENYVTGISFTNSFKGKVINADTIDLKLTNHPVIIECQKQLDEYFNGKRMEFALPIKFIGSDFQNGVWRELLQIPYGRTISYLQLSKNINNVKAIRAVGTANGSNKIVIVVPCHRVIGSNGSLVGYGGDLWRKKWLLDHEAKFGNGVMKLF